MFNIIVLRCKVGVHIDWVWSLKIVAEWGEGDRERERDTAAKTFNYYKIHITSVSMENYSLIWSSCIRKASPSLEIRLIGLNIEAFLATLEIMIRPDILLTLKGRFKF